MRKATITALRKFMQRIATDICEIEWERPEDVDIRTLLETGTLVDP
jgi:hypothetical protein